MGLKMTLTDEFNVFSIIYFSVTHRKQSLNLMNALYVS